MPSFEPPGASNTELPRHFTTPPYVDSGNYSATVSLVRINAANMQATTVHIESVSVDEDQMIVEPDRKRSRWSREEDERLKDLKTRGRCWWETEQQFPLRGLSALQQRWSSKLQAGVITDD
ncbi:hypothetical protein AJ78_05616 [Emergomyces pasteurianus Ep9510]|uniref:Myb-like domain-containing protein n=1 Tax=Emergomyces pasteurianus Ep9510 TaxID=1447872 RepID=A0A1J9Q1E7_9EURO|nr:hypothetical protein AJ78_05616 [Emergomyces pasteurianus Ep9510]